MLTLILGGLVVLAIFAVCKAAGTSRKVYYLATGIPLLLAFVLISLTVRFDTHAFCLPGYVLGLIVCGPPTVFAILLGFMIRK